jgi:SAM-dependent methyltransferase
MAAPAADHYDRLYSTGYMSGFTDVYEYCRVKSVSSVLRGIASSFQPKMVLDVGCGQGRYTALLRECFPAASVTGVDFSPVAVEMAKHNIPDAAFVVGRAEDLSSLAPSSFDFLLSIEVLEHVEDVHQTISEFARVLAPKGQLLVTTPCANRFSLEWVENQLRGGLKASPDGFKLFRTDPPEHVRRLTSKQLCSLLEKAGLRVNTVVFRGHLLTRPCYMAQRLSRLPVKAFGELAYLDWRLMRNFPNDSTMLITAVKA